MSQNITLLGASYTDVPAVTLPKTGGGTAQFDDTTDADATAADILSGKTAYVNGVKVTGTGSGGGTTEAPDNDVIFIDYDGTILYSYSAAEFANLSALPANPSHSGLTAQGWNWTLADAKTYVATYGILVIGQMYTTSDGKTRIYLTIPKNAASDELQIWVRFKSSTANNTTVDWGDGTTETKGSTTVTNYSHTYSQTGDYIITITVNTGTITIVGTSGTTGNSIYGARGTGDNYYKRYRFNKVEVGNNVNIEEYAFYDASNIKTITLPKTCVVADKNNVFNGCQKLRSLVIPTSGTRAYISSCGSLKYLSIPKGVTTVEATNASALLKLTTSGTGDKTCNGASRLQYVQLYEGITSIPIRAYQNCYNLVSITIPSTVTSMDAQQIFNACYSMREYHFKPTSPPTLGNTNSFSGIASGCKIYVPYSADHSVLNNYKTATNWSTYASYMVEESQ